MPDPQNRPPNARVDAAASIAQAQRLAEENQIERASELLEAAIRQEPQHPMLHYKLGILRRDVGDTARARQCFKKTLKLLPDAAVVYYNYARLKKFRRSDPVIASMQQCLKRLDSAPAYDGKTADQVAVLFALGKAYEDCGHFEQAFSYWQRANSLQRRQLAYQFADSVQRVEVIRQAFSVDFIASRGLDPTAGRQPIFLVGMPRSGSTLSEQMLASHSQVEGLGELTVLPALVDNLNSWDELDTGRLRSIRAEYLKAADSDSSADYFTDKLPGNFWRIGVIKLLFPNARIIDVRRHPIDTCLSCYKHLFSGAQPFAYDLDDLKNYYGLYENLMDFWHELFPGEIHTLNYEQLVMQPKATIKAALDYCGLDWQDDCLTFQSNKRAVRTSSASQVREKLHDRAIGHWRRFETQLEVLRPLDMPAADTRE